MASRTIEIQILADAKQLEKALGKAEQSTSTFGSGLKKVGEVAAIAGAAIAGGVAVGLTKSVEAAIEAQKSTARLDAAFKAVGLSAAASAGDIDKAEASGRQLGFTDDDVRTAMGSLVTATGSVSKSVNELAVAQDLARFKGIGLSDATKMLVMAQTGSQRAAKQLGITVQPLTTTYDSLKATMGKTIDATEKLELAHAKLTDKQLTGQAVIDAVSAKVKGQGDAYAQTAAGGMAEFHAQVDHLEETLGAKLLPTLGNVASAVAGFAGKVSEELSKAHTFHAKLEVVWDNIKDISKGIEDALSKAWNGVDTGTIASRNTSGSNNPFQKGIDQMLKDIDWAKAGKSLGDGIVKSVQSINWGTVYHDLSVGYTDVYITLGQVVGSLAISLGKAIGRGTVAGLSDLKSLVGRELDKIPDAITAAAAGAYSYAMGIGDQIVSGTLAGLGDLYGSLKSKIEGTIGGVLSHINVPGFSPPDHAASEAIGQPLGKGTIDGWILGTQELPAKMSQTLQNAIEAARTAIQAAQGTFQTAFGGLSSVLDSALDAIDAKIQTRSEKALAKLQAAHDAAQQAADIADAKAGIASAKTDLGTAKAAVDKIAAAGGGTPEDVAAAQQAETTAKAALVSAQQSLDELLYQKHVAALQKKADAERLNLNATLALQKQHFDASLAALQTALSKHGASAATATADVLKLLAAYGINFKEVGQDMGAAWIEGLKEALEAAAKGAGKLSGTITDAANSIKVPKRAAGGPVTAGQPYWVGERGPELYVPGASGRILPAGSGGGGDTHVHFEFPNYVGSKQELMALIRNEAKLFQNRNARSAFA